MADPTTGREPASGLTAARARLDELERRAKRDCAHENWACGCLGTPPTPAELVEVLRMAGCYVTPFHDLALTIVRRRKDDGINDPVIPVPYTLRAVGAVLTLMEENGR